MKYITIDQLKEELKSNSDNLILINVLSQEHFIDCNISGSISIPLDELPSKVDSLDRSKKVIVHCASNECSASAQAYKILEEAGFTDLYDYKGGIREWIETGQEATNGICTTPYLKKPEQGE